MLLPFLEAIFCLSRGGPKWKRDRGHCIAVFCNVEVDLLQINYYVLAHKNRRLQQSSDI